MFSKNQIIAKTFMNIKLLYFFCFILMTNCTMTGTAFLGPVYTGAKTGSVYQSSLSLGSGKVINRLKSIEKIKRINEPFVENDPKILLAYKVDIIEFSEILEPEPLP